MAIYHLEVKVISRGIGRSAVAAAAYMSCSRLYNDYDGIEHDYTSKHGLVHQEIMLPVMAPAEWTDREKLWNAVEETEKTKDSRLAREFVAALPAELPKEDWIKLLRQYISDNFVSEGMCADFSIHDPTPPGHNPHAHIILTVRPLDENGKWQYKTEKEYLCVRNGKEKGFTASEYKAAQTDGWEKQYQYKIGKKKVYMVPSEAERSGYERASKYPKSTKYGRQNPITERWNSDEQLIKWREAWADTTNRLLQENGIAERIDHRSFKEQGRTEQPTIHEGVSARIMEKQGIISERCEVNRRIKADNRLLLKLKSELQKLSDAVKTSIPKIAQAMELLFTNLIVSRYNLIQAQKAVTQCTEWLDGIKPDEEQYRTLKQKIRSKKSRLRDLQAERKDTTSLNVLKQVKLTQEITTLTEDIEELKSQLSNVYFYYQSEENFKQCCAEIPEWEKSKSKHEETCQNLENRIREQTSEFLSLKESVSPCEASMLAQERGILHDDSIKQARKHLQTAYKDKYDSQQFKTAKTETADSLNEPEQNLTVRQKMKEMEGHFNNPNISTVRNRKRIKHIDL